VWSTTQHGVSELGRLSRFVHTAMDGSDFLRKPRGIFGSMDVLWMGIKKGLQALTCKPFSNMVARGGLEPPTPAL
jgi:hypothetical protein